MDKKKLLIIGGAILIIVIIIILLILPKGNNTPAGGYVSSIVFAKSEDKNKNPIGTTDVFSVNDPEIHAIITYQGLPSGSNVDYQWYDVKADKVLKEDKRPVPSAIFSGLSSAILARDQNTTWGLGDFEFRILIDSKLYAKATYQVKTDAEIQRTAIFSGIGEIELSTAVDLQGKPAKTPATTFSKDDENIYASLSYQNLPASVEMEARWKYVPGDLLITIYDKTLAGSNSFAFGINAQKDSWVPVKKWPVGKYQLEVYLNGDLFKTIEFSVQ